MLNRLSYMLANFLCENQVIERQYIEVYVYGYEVLLDSLIKTAVLLFVGMMTGNLFTTVLFILVFAGLRMYCGGYHAKTSFRCFLLTLIFYLMAIYFYDKIINYVSLTTVQILLTFMIFLTIFAFYAPVENEDKKITTEENKLYKKKSLQILIMCMVVTLLFHNLRLEEHAIIIIAIVEVAVLMIVQRVKENVL